MFNIARSAAGVLLVLVCASSGLADKLRLKDGTTVEGTVIQRTDGYWVKLADGTSKTVPTASVASWDKGTSPAAVATPAAAPAPTTGTPAAKPGTPPVPSPKVVLTFSATKSKAATVDAALAAVALWQNFVDNNPTSPDLASGKAELAKWKELADAGAEKIKGKWVGGAELEAVHAKAASLEKEADALLESQQTLQAVKKLEELNAVYPNFDTSFTLGYVSMIQHNEEKSMEWFNACLRMNPDSPESLANLGIVQMSKKVYLVGLANMRKALELQDRKEIVLNILTAVSSVPPAMQKSKEVKQAEEAARLMAGKYSIAGPAQNYLIVPRRKAPEGGKQTGVTAMWSGTGFIVTDGGLILTNRHVVEGGKTLMAIMPDKTQKAVEVIMIDDEQDLALVKIKPDDGQKLPYVHLASADAPGDGAECTVIGFPLIDRLGAAVKITRGIVSSGSSGRKLAGPDVVVDAKVNPGNSGGPILDRHGYVMAIVSMKTIGSAMEDTYGLGISVGRVRKFLTKNSVKLTPGKDEGASLTAEEIAAKVKPATVCIIGTK